MSEPIQAYPLAWPEGWRRARNNRITKPRRLKPQTEPRSPSKSTEG